MEITPIRHRRTNIMYFKNFAMLSLPFLYVIFHYGRKFDKINRLLMIPLIVPMEIATY